MGRIRTIKPDFYQHEELYDLEQESGLPVRVAFSGLWTQADREGRFEWRPRKLKVNILPYDDIEFSRVLDALETRGFVVKYRVNGQDYGWIPSFLEHQVINNREKDSSLPEPNENNMLTRDARVPDATGTPLEYAQVEGKGKEGKGREGESPNGDMGDKSPADCPHNEIINLYHEILPALRRVREWTDNRQSMLRARWREKPERQSLDWWREYFSRVGKSDFLMGRVSGDGQSFEADLEWLIRPKNMPKVLEGKYDNKKQPKVAEI